jgi:hypothetical protein
MIGGVGNDTMICGDGDELDSLTLMTGEPIDSLYLADTTLAPGAQMALVPDSNAAVTASEAQITSGFGPPVPVYEVTSGVGGDAAVSTGSRIVTEVVPVVTSGAPRTADRSSRVNRYG